MSSEWEITPVQTQLHTKSTHSQHLYGASIYYAIFKSHLFSVWAMYRKEWGGPYRIWNCHHCLYSVKGQQNILTEALVYEASWWRKLRKSFQTIVHLTQTKHIGTASISHGCTQTFKEEKLIERERRSGVFSESIMNVLQLFLRCCLERPDK